jgi:hypothetical protein
MRNFIQCSPCLIEKGAKTEMRNTLIFNVLRIKRYKVLTFTANIGDVGRRRAT